MPERGARFSTVLIKRCRVNLELVTGGWGVHVNLTPAAARALAGILERQAWLTDRNVERHGETVEVDEAGELVEAPGRS